MAYKTSIILLFFYFHNCYGFYIQQMFRFHKLYAQNDFNDNKDINLSDETLIIDENSIEVITPIQKIRTGRSRDEDGKSNIWSIEPTMRVVKYKNNETANNINIKVAGFAITSVILMIPFLSYLSKLFPDVS
jgi:hypothetical protein